MRSYRFRPQGRGEIEFRGFVVYTRFPFGLFSKSLRIEAPERALVFPALEAVQAPPHLGATPRAGDRPEGRGGAGAEVSGLRDYAPGDPVRRIHWPSSLRRNALVVREVRHQQQDEVEVQLRTAGQSAGERFETAVCWAASEVVAFLAAGSRVALRTDAERLPAHEGPAQRARLLAFLARVEPGRAGEGAA